MEGYVQPWGGSQGKGVSKERVLPPCTCEATPTPGRPALPLWDAGIKPQPHPTARTLLTSHILHPTPSAHLGKAWRSPEGGTV